MKLKDTKRENKLTHIFSVSQDEAKKKLSEAQDTARYLQDCLKDLDRGEERRFSRNKPKKSSKKKKDYMECGMLSKFLLAVCSVTIF